MACPSVLSMVTFQVRGSTGMPAVVASIWCFEVIGGGAMCRRSEVVVYVKRCDRIQQVSSFQRLQGWLEKRILKGECRGRG